MRNTGLMHPTDIPLSADYLITLTVTAASSPRFFDWPTGAKFATFGADCNFFINYNTTGVTIPTSSAAAVNAAQPATTTSSAANELNPASRQIPGGSTGGSVISPSTGIISIGVYAP